MWHQRARFRTARLVLIGWLLVIAIPFACIIWPGPARISMLARGYIFCSLRPSEQANQDLPEGPCKYTVSSYVVYQGGKPVGIIAGSIGSIFMLLNDTDEASQTATVREMRIEGSLFLIEFALFIMSSSATILLGADWMVFIARIYSMNRPLKA